MGLSAICPVCRKPSALFETCEKCMDSMADPENFTIMTGFANSSIPPDKLTVDYGSKILNRIPKEDE